MVSFNYNTSKVTQIQQSVSRRLDRPGDLPEPDQLLLSELLSKQDFTDDLKTAATIPRRDLPTYLYAWIELIKREATQSNDTIQYPDKVFIPDLRLQLLEEVLLKRTSNSFLLQVWSVYQQNIKLPALNQLLLKMAERCPDSSRNRPFISWIKQELTSSKNELNLIDHLVKLALTQPDKVFQMGEKLNNHQQAEIYFPRLVNYIPGVDNSFAVQSSGLFLLPVLIYLDILPDSEFLLSFLLEFFQQSADEQIAENSELWRYELKKLAAEKKHLLIQSFYSKFRMEEKWLEINQAIQAALTDETFWNQLDNRSQQYFRQWQMVDRINQHTEDQPRKILFYKNYQLQIREVSHLADDILIISFGDFFLADYKNEDETVWLLDKVLLEMLQEGGYTDVIQFEGSRQTPTARDLIMNKGNSNLARLPLDDVNILYAHDYIRQQTQRIRPK